MQKCRTLNGDQRAALRETREIRRTHETHETDKTYKNASKAKQRTDRDRQTTGQNASERT
ncbi:hypothetical protein MCC01976_04790 [Bifidobacteriaceae bacterium MCC01976]|nr:hypothetical protein MCC01976_04790 [Bifidobacteriaceae bacterium MCC01976]GDZ22953.1 hypothetical protein MCC01977_13570 [Bifidobacteriaceae bacterium MCC01977]